jgi:hypothetical protein
MNYVYQQASKSCETKVEDSDMDPMKVSPYRVEEEEWADTQEFSPKKESESASQQVSYSTRCSFSSDEPEEEQNTTLGSSCFTCSKVSVYYTMFLCLILHFQFRTCRSCTR